MYFSTSSSSSSSPESRSPYGPPIPKSYKFLQIVGEGAFGTVFKCKKRLTGQTVAVKIAKDHRSDLRHEANMLRHLMDHKADKFNIIKYYDDILVSGRMNVVVEMLDISLQDYLVDLEAPLPLKDIRTVIQQLATAFDALKRVGVIHTDVKLDNIMMVDHIRQPFKVKLIDFGLAIFSSQAKPGTVHQTSYYRSPEIRLGLPFSEAIDIWALGCVMAIMMFGFMLFPAKIDYDALRFTIDLLGPPPDHLLNAGQKTKNYFKKTDSDQWMLKGRREYWGPADYSSDDRFYSFRSLDEVKTMGLKEGNKTEAKERSECVELLKAMLQWDEKDRITPAGILNHPFITKSYLNSTSHISSCNEPESSTSQADTRTNERTMTQAEESTSKALPSGVIMVQPAAPTNTTQDRDMSPHSAAVPADMDDTGLPPATFDVSGDQTTKRKKKKKNVFQRFFSWMKKKTFGSRGSADDVQE